MKVLLIGYGSIGKRHESVLASFSNIDLIDIVTKQELPNKNTYTSLDAVRDINSYDYYLICSETIKHYEQLKYLDRIVKNKIIFCEKPLFDSKREFEVLNNTLCVGYVLRFHPLLKKLKSMLSLDHVISINVICGQYLPTWRVDTDYKTSYSAQKSKGGGVLLDLSHEIDYIQWLLGPIKNIQSWQLKISDLEIDSDDIVTLIGRAKGGSVVNISLDYISKNSYRKVIVHGLNLTYELDFIQNQLLSWDKEGSKDIYKAEDMYRNYMFEQMHQSILQKGESTCSFDEAMSVMETIHIIQEQNR